MKYYVDARGKQCPIPVVETRKVLEKAAAGDVVETLVDNEIAVQNLLKMAGQKGLKARWEKRGEQDYRVSLAIETGKRKEEKPGEETGEKKKDESGETDGINVTGEAMEDCKPCRKDGERVLVVLSSDRMWEGDEKLGRTLMKGFLYALTGLETPPAAILLYNGGARLSVEGSECLEDLKRLEGQGTEILTCGTCLNHYGLTEKLAVGRITDMYTICEKMTQADKVVKP